MALVLPGAGIAGISGSIGGTTFAKNRSGLYMRNRTKPVNPNSTRQQQVRQAVALGTTRWSQVLTAAERAAWNLFAASVVMKNRLGQDIKLTGQNHYLRSFTVLNQIGETPVDPGPTAFELPEQDTTLAIAISAATQTVSVTFDATAVWANEDAAFLQVAMGTPQNPQREFFGGPWRYMDVVAGDGTTPPTSPASMAAPFAVAAGQRVWVKARIVRADGRVSEPFRADTFCAA